MTEAQEGEEEQKGIIETVKGRIGGKTVFVPVDSTGKPLGEAKPEEFKIYDKKGRVKKPPKKGTFVETEA